MTHGPLYTLYTFLAGEEGDGGDGRGGSKCNPGVYNKVVSGADLGPRNGWPSSIVFEGILVWVGKVTKRMWSTRGNTVGLLPLLDVSCRETKKKPTILGP